MVRTAPGPRPHPDVRCSSHRRALWAPNHSRRTREKLNPTKPLCCRVVSRFTRCCWEGCACAQGPMKDASPGLKGCDCGRVWPPHCPAVQCSSHRRACSRCTRCCWERYACPQRPTNDASPGPDAAVSGLPTGLPTDPSAVPDSAFSLPSPLPIQRRSLLSFSLLSPLPS